MATAWSGEAARTWNNDRRLKMVEDVLTGRTELGGKAARDLAVYVLHALDHIPERVR